MNTLVVRWNEEDKPLELLPCPFCGGEPKILHTGNNLTKKRKIEIKCSNPDCRASQTNGAIYHDFAWLENVCAEAWNRRTR